MAVTSLRNSFEGGTDGITLTTGNSGGLSGDAFTAVAAWVFTDVHPLDTMAIRTVNPGTSLFVVRWAFSAAAAAQRIYVYLTTLPSVDVQLLHLGDTVPVTFIVTSGGFARITANSVAQWTASASFPVGEWVRVEMVTTASTNSADGTMMGAYYLLDDISPVEQSTLLTGLNTAGASGLFANSRMGKNSSGSYPGDIYLDNVAVDHGPAVEIVNYIGPQTLPPPELESGPQIGILRGHRLG